MFSAPDATETAPLCRKYRNFVFLGWYCYNCYDQTCNMQCFRLHATLCQIRSGQKMKLSQLIFIVIVEVSFSKCWKILETILYFHFKFKVDILSVSQCEEIYISSPCSGPTATGWPAYNSTTSTLCREVTTRLSNFGTSLSASLSR